MNSSISPAARGEQPPLSLAVCARAGEGARGTVCLPAGGAGRVPHGRRAPPSIASPALCAGLRLAVFAGVIVRAGSRDWGCCERILAPRKARAGTVTGTVTLPVTRSRRGRPPGCPWAVLRGAHPAAQAFHFKGKAEPESTGKERK